MARLILIKHAAPRIDPAVPSRLWPLSAPGRASCGWLADAVAALDVTRLYSSLEPKALETASLVAARVGLTVEPRPDLHENDRTDLGFLSQDGLRDRIRQFFERPDAINIGTESADIARARFETAVRAAVAEAGGRDLAIVSHGTVISLLVSRYNPVAPYDLWATLGLPSYVVLDAASFTLAGPVYN